MTINRYFTSTGVPTTISAPLGASGNPIVPVITGLPSSYPFPMIIDLGKYSGTTLYQEVILVTGTPTNNGNGTWTLPCTRGQDGTTAQSHVTGASIVHGIISADPNDFQTHQNATATVHGVTGSVVGTTQVQTLTNKSLDRVAVVEASGYQGVATLSSGVVVVSSTVVTANSRIQLTAQDNNSTGSLRVSARTAGSTFTITSSNSADHGVVAYEICQPG